MVLQGIGGFRERGGLELAVHYPPWWKVYPPPGFLQIHYSEGFWPGTPTGWSSWKNGDAPKELLVSILGNNVLNAFISSDRRKLNYRRVEVGRIFLIVFFYLYKNSFFYFQPFYGILLFLTLKINIGNYLQSPAKQDV